MSVVIPIPEVTDEVRVVPEPSPPEPSRTRFEEQLRELLQGMVTMAVTCSEMLFEATDALKTQNPRAIQDVLEKDDQVDELERRIEAEVIRLLALQQPVLGSDLRFVNLALKAITDLERIGDHCVNIARVAQQMDREGILYQPLVDIERLQRTVAVMLDDTIQALIRRDLTLARQVIAADEEADRLYRRMQEQLRTKMRTGDAGMALRGSYLLFVLHYLERIGDHCVGIAERLPDVARCEVG
ncbi:MAG: phosphate signaling complex protein PhoU [Capsulimonadales bacterium]|nr:phosphate signaling complex protein PhoU [Capsulimonadales bacterium]